MIAVIRYNAGNVQSVMNTLSRFGAKAVLTDDPDVIRDADKVIFPGVGEAGSAMRYLNEHGLSALIRSLKQPFLGICLGMQVAVIEASRSLAGLCKANSREFDENGSECVIDLMDEQRNITSKGGTMRLGSYPCLVKNGTVLHEIYRSDMVSERHRHRYEVSPVFRERIEKSGIVFSGTSPDGKLVEAMENPHCRFFVAVQAHPEFKSRPNRVHPLFDSFIKASLS